MSTKNKIGLALSLIVCAVLAVVALSPSGMAAATAPAMPMAIARVSPLSLYFSPLPIPFQKIAFVQSRLRCFPGGVPPSIRQSD